MDESDALALVVGALAQDGHVAGEWIATPVLGLGWVFGAADVRSTVGYAVTCTGRVGRYVKSVTSARDALQRLAALPEPPAPGAADAAAAVALAEAELARHGAIEHTGWRHTDIGELGWRLVPTGVGREIGFVVTRHGRVSLCPASDPTGEATAQELMARPAPRIIVVDLS